MKIEKIKSGELSALKGEFLSVWNLILVKMCEELGYTTDKDFASCKLLTAISQFDEVFAFCYEGRVVVFVSRRHKGSTGIAILKRTISKSNLSIQYSYCTKKNFLEFHFSSFFKTNSFWNFWV